jgi:DNA replication protein DnaC
MMQKLGDVVDKMRLPKRSGAPRSHPAPEKDVCPLCHGLGFLSRDVPPDDPEYGTSVPCQCTLRRLESRRQDALLRMSDLGPLSRLTFDAFVAEGHAMDEGRRRSLRYAYDRCLAYAQDPKGWLLLRGGYGTGKTHLAAAIANHCVAHGRSALFVVVPDLLDYLRASFNPEQEETFDERFQSICDSPLLILDDLGTQSSTAWAREKLFQIFNHRYNAQLPTVVTTNCVLEDLDDRLRSRFLDQDLVEVVAINALDYRGGSAPKAAQISTLSAHGDMRFARFDPRTRELEPAVRQNLHEILVSAQEFAANPDGRWLVFQGTYGCGKTHLAAAIANQCSDEGHSVLFIVVPDLLDLLRATYSPDSAVSYDRRLDEIRGVELLVLDDLGTESATPWAREKLYQIFNHRYAAHLATVITTSERLDQLDPRLRSRMLDKSRCTVAEVQAPSYRGQEPAPSRAAPPPARPRKTIHR